VSGRVRVAGEMNGKSGNMNNALNQIYPKEYAIPGNELVCVFDADQVAKRDFFLKTLPYFDAGKTPACCLPGLQPLPFLSSCPSPVVSHFPWQSPTPTLPIAGSPPPPPSQRQSPNPSSLQSLKTPSPLQSPIPQSPVPVFLINILCALHCTSLGLLSCPLSP